MGNLNNTNNIILVITHMEGVRREALKPLTEEEAKKLWDKLSTAERIDLLKMANYSLGASETDLFPYSSHSWDSMPATGLARDLKKRILNIGRHFESTLRDKV